MKLSILKISLLSFAFTGGILFAQTKPLYQLPEHLPAKPDKKMPLLTGTDSGLYKVQSNGISDALWADGKVDQIYKTKDKWYFLTDKGIISSQDLKTFTECNNGLPFLTIKTYENKAKKLLKQAAILKDLSIDPLNSLTMVTATKDNVYLTRDGGESWKSIGSMSKNSSGMKAVAVASMPVYASDGSITSTQTIVFMSHPIYGMSWYDADSSSPKWHDVSAGFAAMPSLTQPDEIADILPVICKTKSGVAYCDIYLSQTFLPKLYMFDWKNKKAIKIYEGTEQCDTIDGLWLCGTDIWFSSMGQLSSYSLEKQELNDNTGKTKKWAWLLNSSGTNINAAYVPETISGLKFPLQLSELWLLKPDQSLSAYDGLADKKKAVYASAYQMRNMDGITKYRKILKDNKLNALVVDMKDDYGYLRFEPKSELLKQKGKVTGYKIDLNKFVEEYKKDGTYLIGRIVVFKDKNLSNYAKGKYAVWNYTTNSPWIGTRGMEDVLDEEGNPTGEQRMSYYDENWVDPYSEEVWEYNVEIAKELIERGFDEIQFDYIRFPTDGQNLGKASFRWKDAGMDKESALTSFLKYARENIDAPIGIDIYGANGWYRTGARTGQDVELLSRYVDVICPMYYPSHFEQDFLEYKPVVERPYRIYFYGSYRNSVIGRNRVIIRPWIQAFYMRVRYDKAYYDKNYVLREIFGVRDGLDRGYMYWNNSGGYYEDISPDPQDTEISPWAKDEADLQKRLPAFGSKTNKYDNISMNKNDILQKQRQTYEEILSILNTVLDQEWTETADTNKTNSTFLFVPLD